MTRGTITKALSGFYYVRPDEEPNIVYQCRARGIFKKRGVTPLVGDIVDVELSGEEEVEGMVTKIIPRKNEFIRPPVANIELFAAVISAKDPAPNTDIMDRFLATAEYRDTKVLICLNKCDLADAAAIAEIYEPIYPILSLSAKTGEGIDGLKNALSGLRVAFAGPSGVGKSSLINRLTGGAIAETGEISPKTGRGRHTTRHIEIFFTDFDAALYDTPGYTSFESGIYEDKVISDLFPEIEKYSHGCRFDDCIHINEPDCAVIAAVKSGKIARSRYGSYKRMTEESAEHSDRPQRS